MPSLCWADPLECLTELRETSYLLGYRFTVRGRISGRAWWKRRAGRGLGGGREASMPSAGEGQRSPGPFHTLPTPKAPRTLLFWVLMQDSLQRHKWLHHRSLGI